MYYCTIRAKKSEPYGFVLWGGEGGGDCESDKDMGRRCGGLLSDELAYFQGIRGSFGQSTIVPAPHPPNQPNS